MKSAGTTRSLAHSLVLAVALLLLGANDAMARVVRVEILSRSDIAGTFGGHVYERVIGRVYFAFDPRSPANRQIVDLDLAARNPNGEVGAVSEFIMLRPKDSSDLAVIDIVNRGGMTTFVFNLGRNAGATALTADYYGDALLMKRGVTIVALGWQWDVPAGQNSLHFEAPHVGSAARPVTGLVRSDITIDAPTTTFSLGHSLASAVAYPSPIRTIVSMSLAFAIIRPGRAPSSLAGSGNSRISMEVDRCPRSALGLHAERIPPGQDLRRRLSRQGSGRGRHRTRRRARHDVVPQIRLRRGRPRALRNRLRRVTDRAIHSPLPVPGLQCR